MPITPSERGLSEMVFFYLVQTFDLLCNPDEGLKGTTVSHLTFRHSLSAVCLHGWPAPALLLECDPWGARCCGQLSHSPRALLHPARENRWLRRQQRLFRDDGLNSVVVAEVVLLRSYRSGKHTWKIFKQTWTQKAEQNIRFKTTPIRKSQSCLVLVNNKPAAMSFALQRRDSLSASQTSKGHRQYRRCGFRLSLKTPNSSDYLYNQRSPGNSSTLDPPFFWYCDDTGEATSKLYEVLPCFNWNVIITFYFLASVSQEHFLQHWATFQA